MVYQSAVIKKTTTNVLTASVVIATANPKRKAYKVWNNSGNSGYVTWGATSASASPTRIIATFTSWEPADIAVYTGDLSAIRNSGSGNMVVYELE